MDRIECYLWMGEVFLSFGSFIGFLSFYLLSAGKVRYFYLSVHLLNMNEGNNTAKLIGFVA